MSKLDLGVIFGGQSTEHDVSVMSGMSVIEHLNRQKYNVFPIYIDKDGTWYEYKQTNDISDEEQFSLKVYSKTKIKNIITYLKKLDIVFPVLHGKYGEDGSIQGMLEMFKIPYVGTGILSSSLGMDKVYTKMILEKAGIKQAKYCYIRIKQSDNYYLIDNFEEIKIDIKEINKIIKKRLKYPVFVKPSNSGSSIGVSKVDNKNELENALKEASKYDDKILIEEYINGKEIECAVLEKDNIIASCTGEILPAEDYYTYDAKYNSKESRLKIPSGVKCEEKIKEIAIKAFKAIDGKGLSRVDFFVKDDEIYLNEINTMPGFTSISMYPKLFEHVGISYTELLDCLINH